jgi:hypothetical protein
MSDGANLGVDAQRALETILGGREEPGPEERVSIEEMEARIRAHPLPGQGTPPHETAELDDAYNQATECIAHAFLVLADENPSLLTEQRYYDGSEMDDSIPASDATWWRENMAGKAKDPTDALWEAFRERWPDGDEWVGGSTGFMVGWAFNAVRTIKGLHPTQNPAIVEVPSPE